MKAIKKRIERKYSIPTEDTLVITAKDNTQRLAKALEDVIITEDDGSQYSMAKTTFDKKYDIIDDSTCISKANEIDFVLNTTDKNIVFLASWGEQITAFPGAAIVLENGTFGYAIQAKEFEETYDVVGKIESTSYISIWYLPNPDDFDRLNDDANKDTGYFQGIAGDYVTSSEFNKSEKFYNKLSIDKEVLKKLLNDEGILVKGVRTIFSINVNEQSEYKIKG